MHDCRRWLSAVFRHNDGKLLQNGYNLPRKHYKNFKTVDNPPGLEYIIIVEVCVKIHGIVIIQKEQLQENSQ